MADMADKEKLRNLLDPPTCGNCSLVVRTRIHTPSSQFMCTAAAGFVAVDEYPCERWERNNSEPRKI